MLYYVEMSQQFNHSWKTIRTLSFKPLILPWYPYVVRIQKIWLTDPFFRTLFTATIYMYEDTDDRISPNVLHFIRLLSGYEYADPDLCPQYFNATAVFHVLISIRQTYLHIRRPLLNCRRRTKWLTRKALPILQIVE